jgi:hypothetical protein
MGLPGPTQKGSRLAKKRVEFTADDDDELCIYLASRAPENGGRRRMGNEVYKELADLVSHVLISVRVTA